MMKAGLLEWPVSARSVSKNDFTCSAALAGAQRRREPDGVRRAMAEGQDSMGGVTGDTLSARGAAWRSARALRTPAAALQAWQTAHVVSVAGEHFGPTSGTRQPSDSA